MPLHPGALRLVRRVQRQPSADRDNLDRLLLQPPQQGGADVAGRTGDQDSHGWSGSLRGQLRGEVLSVPPSRTKNSWQRWARSESSDITFSKNDAMSSWPAFFASRT